MRTSRVGRDCDPRRRKPQTLGCCCAPTCWCELRRDPSRNASGSIGDQTGGRVFLFLHTDDFWRDYRALQTRGIVFTEQPRTEAYGTVVVFLDLYGNKWDLIEPTVRQ